MFFCFLFTPLRVLARVFRVSLLCNHQCHEHDGFPRDSEQTVLSSHKTDQTIATVTNIEFIPSLFFLLPVQYPLERDHGRRARAGSASLSPRDSDMKCKLGR
ncbi:hypothetical protein L209DRAFT_366245 [Thermothelomyces heterothallicus CBS 203.75]